MKIIATKYNYQIKQALDHIEYFEEHDELDEDFLIVKKAVENTPEGKCNLLCNEEYEHSSDLKKERILNEFLIECPDNILAKNELLFTKIDSKYYSDYISKLFLKEREYFEMGTEYSRILSLEEFRMITMNLSRYYKRIEDKVNHKKLLRCVFTKGFHELSETIVTDMNSLEFPLPSLVSMTKYDDVNIWTHNLLISDLFDSLNELPYNIEFLGLIKWSGSHLDHDLYIKILDSKREYIFHDVK